MIQKRFSFFLLIFLFIISTTYFLIKFAKGYKLDLSQKAFRPTGLLVATSTPDGGQIYIDGKLASATNTTLSLAPDTYEIEIKKDGYTPWKKTLKIEKELVTKTDAWLFPLVPDFRALTFTGAANPLLSSDGTKVVYQVSDSNLPEKNGLWVLDLSDLPFGLSREPRLIVKSAPRGRDFAKSAYYWSPDSRQILLTLKQTKQEESFLLDSNSFSPTTQLIDIRENLPAIKEQWEKEERLKQEQKLSKLPTGLTKIIKENARDVLFSPDETKVLYTATASAMIPDKLIPPLPAASNQTQERNIKPNRTYIYDIKEDRNFLIIDQKVITNSQRLNWFPTSKHLLLAEKDKVQILEYDSRNWVTVYAGPYQFPFAFPFPAGNKLLILTTLSTLPESLPNLYAVGLR